VAAERAAGEAEGAEQEKVDQAVKEEDNDGGSWYDATEDVPPPGQQAALVSSFETAHHDVVYDGDLAAVNMAIEDRLVKLSRMSTEAEHAANRVPGYWGPARRARCTLSRRCTRRGRTWRAKCGVRLVGEGTGKPQPTAWPAPCTPVCRDQRPRHHAH
jgi:hypothetical protein